MPGPAEQAFCFADKEFASAGAAGSSAFAQSGHLLHLTPLGHSGHARAISAPYLFLSKFWLFLPGLF